MSLENSIRRVFRMRKEPRSTVSSETSNSLAYLGYPRLSASDFFLGSSGVETWREHHSLLFPPKCCVCLNSAVKSLPSRGDVGWLGLFRKGPAVGGIPHCDEHGRGAEANLLVLLRPWSEWVIHVSLIGLNEVFLANAKTLNQQGDMPPPWRAFPAYNPETSGWRQGNGEHWLLYAWSPFWKGLSLEEREHYLQRWDAPLDWKSFWN